MSLRIRKRIEEDVDKVVEENKEDAAQQIEKEETPKIVLEQPHGEIEHYYLEALYNAHAIKMKKAIDYNSGRVKRTDYYLYGEKSIIGEIWKKVLRLVSLFDSEQEPNNESIEDNLLDTINYCADLYSYMRWKEDNSKEEEQ
jgi:hypothetical protein